MQRTVFPRPFCPSVCLSIKRVDCDKTKETCAHMKDHSSLQFSNKKNGWWGDPFYPNCWSENADFQSIFARSASAVTPSENNSINTNRKSTTHFPMSLRWTLCVAPKPLKGRLKTQNGRFPSKFALHLKKVCYYKVSLCEYCQRQSCKAFTDLSIHAKMVREGRPLLRENMAETDQPPSKTSIPINVRSWHLSRNTKRKKFS